MAATATLALEQSEYCELHVNTRATQLEQLNDGWCVHTVDQQGHNQPFKVDFLVNACGFRTGLVDDMAGYRRERLVEYKAAYVAHWQTDGHWPEVIFHGPRGTPQGMAQLTPYPNGIYQLHGMTDSITLFKDGLVASSAHSAQPELPQPYQTQLDHGWQTPDITQRTQDAISHLARMLPAFKQATVAGKPLFGAQQIPGSDPSLRAADVSFEGAHYARVEIVKASSALTAADRIVYKLADLGWLTLSEQAIQHGLSPQLTITTQHSAHQIEASAVKLTQQRGYPEALALNMD